MTTKKETLSIKKAMKETNDRRMFERYLAIHLYLKGYTNKDISDIILRSTKTISTYVKAYKERGIEGLERGQPKGAPRKLTESQEQELIQLIAYKTPSDIGYKDQYNWTLSIVAEFIQREWGKTYTLRGVSLLLNKLGFSYTRPTYTFNTEGKIGCADLENDTHLNKEAF